MTRSLELLRLEKEAEEYQNEVCFTSQLESPKQLEAKGVCIQKLQVCSIYVVSTYNIVSIRYWLHTLPFCVCVF